MLLGNWMRIGWRTAMIVSFAALVLAPFALQTFAVPRGLLSPCLQETGPKRVPEKDLEAPIRVAHEERVDYPQDAWRAGVAGEVKLHVVISTDGAPKSIEAVSGDPGLSAAAIQAVTHWRFDPMRLNGEPVEIDANLLVGFSLLPVDNRPGGTTSRIKTVVGGERVDWPARIQNVSPLYPMSARKKGICGKVVIHATISKEGVLENLAVVSGPPALTQASLDAVRQWRYLPKMVNGEPVQMETDIDIQFSLGERPCASR